MSRIAVIGAGYVGLVTGVCFAQKNNFVTIIEKDKNKIESLLAGKVPFYEPGLDDLLKNAINQNKIVFVNSINKALKDNPQIIFSCVGTPSMPDGDADLSAVWNVATEVGKNLNDYCLFINKSTVPVGTAKKVENIISQELKNRDLSLDFDVASNPEFLKEGDALNDFLMPDRIVVGIKTDKAKKILENLYKPFVSKKDQFICMNIESAELTKYASNAMLATRISFMNQLALLADKVGADIFDVKNGIAKDSRIGSAFLNPGIGYGGSCFPKDVKALIKIGEKNNQEMSMIRVVDKVNDYQRQNFINKIISYYGRNLSEKKVGIWGLSFKPETDDIRSAPSIDVIKRLLDYEADIIAYDPQAQSNIRNIFDNKIKFDSAKNILNKVDFLIILTEWKEFLNYKTNDFKILNDKVIFDGRNCFDPIKMKSAGIRYFNIGRNNINKITFEEKNFFYSKEDLNEISL
ncbi:nucleotide sugar dehydrogenase [Candidatus Dependentiae bacterium]|nr:nucleotide sugar dehydrogenase [Candidatus Dependentiae bacterium]